ncbi:MAG: hypothetical protein RSD07_02160 [Angelakisella sp.]
MFCFLFHNKKKVPCGGMSRKAVGFRRLPPLKAVSLPPSRRHLSLNGRQNPRLSGEKKPPPTCGRG